MASSKSPGVTNRDSARYTPRDRRYAHGRQHYRVETLALLAAGSTIGDVHRFHPVRSNYVVSELRASISPVTTGAADIGLHVGFGGAVIDPDVFRTAVTIAAVNKTDFLSTNAAAAILHLNRQLWEVVNALTPGTYARDPMQDWDISFTITTVLNVDTTVILEMVYTAGD